MAAPHEREIDARLASVHVPEDAPVPIDVVECEIAVKPHMRADRDQAGEHASCLLAMEMPTGGITIQAGDSYRPNWGRPS
jgi:hypothetical protein